MIINKRLVNTKTEINKNKEKQSLFELGRIS